MGGSGGGGGFSSSDMAKLQEAADARLKSVASQSTKILFACEKEDRKALEARLAKSAVFKAKDRVVVIDSSQAGSEDKALAGSTFLCLFTDAAKTTKFLDVVIDKALAAKLSGVHVQANPSAVIPSKVTAYRWRSISWNELEAIFK